MSDVFILQNQHRYFYSKQGDWVDGRDAKALFRTPHKDEAVNQCVEITAKDYTQRVNVVASSLNEKGFPQLQEDQLPPPMEDPADNIDAADDLLSVDAADGVDADELPADTNPAANTLWDNESAANAALTGAPDDDHAAPVAADRQTAGELF